MQTALRFDEVLEAADNLPPEDQENLIDILQRRRTARRRQEIVAAVEEAKQEYRDGKCKAMTPAEIMAELLS